MTKTKTPERKLSRPELDRMLDDLKAGRIDGIVVAQVAVKVEPLIGRR